VSQWFVSGVVALLIVLARFRILVRSVEFGYGKSLTLMLVEIHAEPVATGAADDALHGPRRSAANPTHRWLINYPLTLMGTFRCAPGTTSASSRLAFQISKVC
jgi:hypothetical protein